MKKKRLLLWLILPAVLWFSACNTEINTDDKTGSTMSVNLRAKSGDDVKARLVFWRESDYHGLESVPAIPYCVCLPGNPINSYQSSTNLPYNTGVPYPNTYEKLHVTGYSPQELLPENGSGQDVLSGDYRTIPLTDKYKGGKSDILSCSGAYTGSEEQPFDGQQTNLLFEHASTRMQCTDRTARHVRAAILAMAGRQLPFSGMQLRLRLFRGRKVAHTHRNKQHPYR